VRSLRRFVTAEIVHQAGRRAPSPFLATFLYYLTLPEQISAEAYKNQWIGPPDKRSSKRSTSARKEVFADSRVLIFSSSEKSLLRDGDVVGGGGRASGGDLARTWGEAARSGGEGARGNEDNHDVSESFFVKLPWIKVP
jgi:hypothetical protein